MNEQNSSVSLTLTSNQILGESQALVFGNLPLDCGLSKLDEADNSSVILSDGRVVKLTGTHEDIVLVSQDRGMRVKQTLAHLYLNGRNLAVTRDTFISQYGNTNEFWKTLTALTGFSRAKLENEIKIAENFTADEISLLVDAGASQTIAVKLLKNSSLKKEALEEAKEGKLLTHSVVQELSEQVGADIEDDADTNVVAEPTKTSKLVSDLQTGESASSTPQVIGIPATPSVAYSQLVTDTKDFVAAQNTSAERLENLLNAVWTARNKHDLSTVRGEAIRTATCQILAGFFGITLPNEHENEDEPKWIKEMRDKLPKTQRRRISAIFLMAYTEGHLGFIQGDSNPPQAYEGLFTAKRMTRDSVDALYELWAIGYAQAKFSANSAK